MLGDLLELVLRELSDGGHPGVSENSGHVLGPLIVRKRCQYVMQCWKMSIPIFLTSSGCVSTSGHFLTPSTVGKAAPQMHAPLLWGARTVGGGRVASDGLRDACPAALWNKDGGGVGGGKLPATFPVVLARTFSTKFRLLGQGLGRSFAVTARHSG